MPKGEKKAKSSKQEPRTLDQTIHMHKYTWKVGFLKRAPKAILTIRRVAAKTMGTRDVRIDTKLNKFIWSRGVRNTPTRVRVRLSRKRNDDEEAKEKMFTLVQHIPVESFKGLATENVRDD
mmetsp:Transcript_22121/g.49104  ORF Transcript_22121/g.49104 Transcript_22121/m.49104 type:complete len:121 (+) Transcript_22121:97-459(+)